MKAMAIVTVLAVLGWADQAHAQHIIGTQGTPAASLGYYSPYPGALYSPFKQPAPIIPQSATQMGGMHFGGYPQIYNNGHTVTRIPGPTQVPPSHSTNTFKNSTDTFKNSGFRRR